MQLMIKCPYHQDDNASCSVDPDAGVFICFACRKSGLTYDLVRDLGLTIPEALDRELVKKVLAKKASFTSTGFALGLPSFAVHTTEQIHRLWQAARPAAFGIGWTLTRANSALLEGFGVDYVSGLVCFRQSARFGDSTSWSEALGQVREAREGGQYFSIGPASHARCRFRPSQGFARNMILVEGPFDGLRVIEAIGQAAMDGYGVEILVCGGTRLPGLYNYAGAQYWSMFDNDEAGVEVREAALTLAQVTPIPYEGEDPGSARMSDLYDAITSHLT